MRLKEGDMGVIFSTENYSDGVMIKSPHTILKMIGS